MFFFPRECTTCIAHLRAKKKNIFCIVQKHILVDFFFRSMQKMFFIFRLEPGPNTDDYVMLRPYLRPRKIWELTGSEWSDQLRSNVEAAAEDIRRCDFLNRKYKRTVPKLLFYIYNVKFCIFVLHLL